MSKSRYRPEHMRMLNDKRWAQTKAIVDARARGLCEWCIRDGKDYGYGKKAKSLQHRTPASVAMDQRIHFDDYDREIADYEAEGWEGEIRQREEPPEDMSDHD